MTTQDVRRRQTHTLGQVAQSSGPSGAEPELERVAPHLM